MGNFLNSGTSRGGIAAFSLDSLTKLTDVKSNGQTNMLEYLIDFIDEKYPTVADWLTDFADVRHATKVSWPTIKGDMETVKKGLADSTSKAAKVEKGDEKWDVFYKTMPAALKEAAEQF